MKLREFAKTLHEGTQPWICTLCGRDADLAARFEHPEGDPIMVVCRACKERLGESRTPPPHQARCGSRSPMQQ